MKTVCFGDFVESIGCVKNMLQKRVQEGIHIERNNTTLNRSVITFTSERVSDESSWPGFLRSVLIWFKRAFMSL